MVTMNQPSADDSAGADVDARALELMTEFENHFRDVVAMHPEVEARREHVFQAWTMQKLAGLQLVLEDIARKFNAHVGSGQT